MHGIPHPNDQGLRSAPRPLTNFTQTKLYETWTTRTQTTSRASKPRSPDNHSAYLHWMILNVVGTVEVHGGGNTSRILTLQENEEN